MHRFDLADYAAADIAELVRKSGSVMRLCTGFLILAAWCHDQTNLVLDTKKSGDGPCMRFRGERLQLLTAHRSETVTWTDAIEAVFDAVFGGCNCYNPVFAAQPY